MSLTTERPKHGAGGGIVDPAPGSSDGTVSARRGAGEGGSGRRDSAKSSKGSNGSKAPSAKPAKNRLRLNIVLQVVGMAAIGLLVYPDAANWVNSISHNGEITGYVRQVEGTPREERQRVLDAAYAYNDQLEPGPLTDPYISMAEDAELRTELYEAYQEMLRISGTDAIGTLNYPAVGVSLPMYHGTSDEVISKGVGHMYGTSLPVGGPSTRSVLTAHSGLPSAKLFTPLHDAKVGDTFWISVLGEDHHYRVEELETVEPGQTDSFRIIENEDWVTLFTCTPIGVNSHRLLVHAQRIDGPEAEGLTTLMSDDLDPGFPWWAVWFFGGSGALAYLLLAPPRKKRTRAPEAAEGVSPSASAGV